MLTNIRDELDRLIDAKRTIREHLSPNMFSRVEFYDLKVGEKYKIYRNPYEIRNYYTGIVREHKNSCVIIDRFRFNSYRKKTKGFVFRNNMKLSGDYDYYAYVSKKDMIQQSMEQRALDKILKRLINDDFSW
jgi:hypothetical protein